MPLTQNSHSQILPSPLRTLDANIPALPTLGPGTGTPASPVPTLRPLVTLPPNWPGAFYRPSVESCALVPGTSEYQTPSLMTGICIFVSFHF